MRFLTPGLITNVLRVQQRYHSVVLWPLPLCYAQSVCRVSSECVEVTKALSGFLNVFFFFTITHCEHTGHKLAVIASDVHNWPAQSN